MHIALIIIVSMIFILLIFQLYQSQTKLRLINNSIKEYKQQLAMFEQIFPNHFNKIKQDIEQKNKIYHTKMLEEQKLINKNISSQISHSLDGIEKIISENISKDLYAYVNFDETQRNKWKELIDIENNQRTKIQYIESALNKFPSHRPFFENYQNMLLDSLNHATLRAQQTIIEKMNHASRVFLDNCKAEDAVYAQKAKDNSIRLGHNLMKKVNQAQEEHFTETINGLEKCLSEKNTNLESIEEIDSSINKELLKNYPQLWDRYQRITAKLTASLIDKPSESKIKAYNLHAIDAFKKAQDYFNKNEKAVKTGVNLNEIIYHLGGWDPQYLSSTTQIYYQSVYADIFGKLDPEIKPQMTKSILQQPVKRM